MKHYAWTLSALGALLVLPVISQATPILLQDDFNAENGGVGLLNYTGFANWKVPTGSVDLIGNGLYDFYPGNGLYVDLDGTTGQAGTLETKTSFTFASGQKYRVSFLLGNNPNNGAANTATVQVNVGNLSQVITTAQAGGPPTFNPISYVFTGNGSTGTLEFIHQGGDNNGLIIDNVKLEAIPEPALYQMGVMLAGGGLMALRLRRKNRK